MMANIVVGFFLQGGPVMWPILIAALVSVAVVGERTFWWLREGRRRDPKRLEQILAALENGDIAAATRIAEGSRDPVIHMIHTGMEHAHTSMQGALQLAAGIELERAGRFLTIMDTLVTLAPLLGLLGTVTGLMRAFLSIGSAELAVAKVTGGIGEALIATACGLGIAIFSLIPFNYFTGRVARLQFELEVAATNVELMVHPSETSAAAVKLEQPHGSGSPTESGLSR
ncbi:MAG TPA: MotA/TolQ/ExbB proton channel family protein [Candidatus Baltobacteraceae bacterium]|jgi:biopolymer transport protein ExbB|nr:MotA/TolQ/ExbB proton channel family protein [Candidatus Baltobacteraceae bacterium]